MSQTEYLLADFMVAMELPPQGNVFSMGFEVGRPVPDFGQVFDVTFGANPGEPEEILIKRGGELVPVPVLIKDDTGELVDASGEVGVIIPIPPPRSTSVPTLSGIAQTGQIMSCSAGVWDFTPITYVYQWLRNGEGIAGSVSDNYTLLVGDEGTIISCRVTATNVAGSTDAVSNAVVPVAPGGSVDPLDGEVTSSAQIEAIVTNPANAGNSYWMRGGSYGELQLDNAARPSSLITFTTYPGEQVVFTGQVGFDRCKNLRFDGNEDNMIRAAAGGHADGYYGLWLRGPGSAGYNVPPAPYCIAFHNASSTDPTENIQFAHFRLGGSMSTNAMNWPITHGIVIGEDVGDILFEDFELAYIGTDLWDQDPTLGGAGDADGGGFGIYHFANSASNGDFTLRRGHFHHTMNDCIQYGPSGTTSLYTIEHCLFEFLRNYGAAHCDFFQIYGGEQELLVDGCVFRNGTDFLFHGSNETAHPRLFRNCLWMDAHQIVLSKDNESGPYNYVFEDCTIHVDDDPEGQFGMNSASVAGSFYTATNNKVRNSIYIGITNVSGMIMDNVWSNGGEPNILYPGQGGLGTGLTGDVVGTPTFNSQAECTNYSQGWRKPVGFPWTL